MSGTLVGSLGCRVYDGQKKTDVEIVPRKGGPKEARLNKTKLMDTGRYFESCIARNEPFQDIDNMHSLRIDNLFYTSEQRLREEFGVFGPLGDVYRPVNKDTKKPLPLVFVRFLKREHMLEAMRQLQGKIIDGRPMKIEEAKSAFELETSIY